MSNQLNVETRVTHPINVAYITYTPDDNEPDQHSAIGKKFVKLTQKVAEHGYDTSKLRVIGVPVTGEKGLIRYECCVEVPEPNDAEDLDFKVIPGGAYSVLIMNKSPEVIGASIGRFYSEYVPEMRLCIDPDRPVLEMYTEDTMEYFVPITEP